MPLEVVISISLAAALGAAVGIERERRGHYAGMRTHTLVAVGAALFTWVGAHGFDEIVRGANADPMRVAAQVVSGIGFIGAGAILRDSGGIRGVTTAAALWTSAAIGVACGAGLYLVATIGTGVTLFALVGLRFLKDHGLTRIIGRQHSIRVVYEKGSGTLGPVVRYLESARANIVNLRIDDESSHRELTLTVAVRDLRKLRSELEGLSNLPEVVRVEIDADD